MNTTIKDTHAYYGYESGWVQVFNTKIGDFKPKITSFYIKQSSTPKYTNVGTNTVYLTPGDNNKNLDQVCITETNNIDTCNDKWKTIDTVNNHYEYIFQDTNTEGNKIIYGFVKDKYGNKSLSSQDSIVYDKTAPTVSYSLTQGTYTGNQTITVTPSDAISGVGGWGVNVTKDGVIDSTKSNTNLAGQTSFTVNLTEGNWVIYTIVYDKAGNRQNTQPVTAEGWYYQSYTIMKPGKTGLDLINDRTSISTLQNTAVNGLYRYYGKYNVVDNNYICLGPSGNTCQTNDDKNKYMYRIIGIADGTESSTLSIDKGQIKVIKAIPLSGEQQWHSDDSTDTDWEGAELQTNLNSTLFYTNTSNILDARIKSKIKSVKWYKGTITGSFNNPPTSEPTDKISDTHPIGLMYASDYYQSWGEYSGNGNKESWLNITHGASTSSSSAVVEWTMTRYGFNGKTYRAWSVYGDGSLGYGNLGTNSYTVRPVFYLQSDVTLTGEGKEGNPYMLIYRLI